MTVVAVLITSCHVSDKPKIGPLINHKITLAHATKNAHGEPVASDVRVATRLNHLVTAAPTPRGCCASAGTPAPVLLRPTSRRAYRSAASCHARPPTTSGSTACPSAAQA